MALKEADKRVVNAFVDGVSDRTAGPSSFEIRSGVLYGPWNSKLATRSGIRIIWAGTGGTQYQDDTYRYLKKTVPKNNFIGHGDIMRLNGRKSEADPDAARELVLYTENDSKLWGPGNTQGASIRKNLEMKKKRGTLDPSKAPKLFEYLMESAAKQYAKDFASPGEWNTMFNKSTRRLAAEEMSETFLEELGLQPNSGKAPFGFVRDANTHDFLRPATRADMLKSLEAGETGEYSDGGRRVYVRNRSEGARPPRPPKNPVFIPAARPASEGRKMKSYRDMIHESERERDVYPFDYAIRNPAKKHMQPEFETLDESLVETMVYGYLEAAIWTGTTEDGDALDEYVVGNFTEDSMLKAVSDVGKFLNTTSRGKNVYDLLTSRDIFKEVRTERSTSERPTTELIFSSAGHDLWLTANGHGSGFWDGDWGSEGDFLTAAAEHVPERSVFPEGEDLYLE